VSFRCNIAIGTRPKSTSCITLYALRGDLEMSTSDNVPQTGIIVAGDTENLDNMSKLVNRALAILAGRLHALWWLTPEIRPMPSSTMSSTI
jgi:hypothetical protein